MKQKGFNARLRRRRHRVPRRSSGRSSRRRIPLIIYGTVTGVSVLQLLLGGILPGLLCVAMLMLMTGWLAHAAQLSARRALADARRAVARLASRRFRRSLAPVILIAGMLAGFFTPTEIASVTVLYTLLISYALLPRADLAGPARRGVRDDPRVVGDPADRGGGGAVRLDPVGRAGAADADRLDALDLEESLRAAADRQRAAAGRRHVPRQHDGDPGDRADHRQAADAGRRRSACTSAWSWCST